MYRCVDDETPSLDYPRRVGQVFVAEELPLSLQRILAGHFHK